MRFVALILAFGLGTGCGARGEVGAPETRDAPVIQIVNRNWADMDVYLARDGIRAFLGFVTTGSTATFPAPADLIGAAGDLRLIAEPVGSSLVFRSEPFRIDPGQVVEWTIGVRPAYSSLVIY